MIDKQNFIDLVEQYLLEAESDSYLIDVVVNKDNLVVVEIDNDEAVDIDECAAISRYIDERMDRDVEDFELEVGSAGLTSPLKKLRQFEKFEGEEMEVLCKDGQKLKGVLGAADEEGFELTFTKKVKPEGSKKKIEVTETKRFLHKEVNQVRYNF